MGTSSFNPDAFKAMQRQSWGAASAGWLKWAEVQEKATRPLTLRLLQMARISPGLNVLDIASGVGDPSIAAALHVGPSGSVLATDQSLDMLNAARKRASDFGVENMSFLETDAELLSLPTQTFDAALCRWGLMFLPNLPEALSRIYDALTRGGTFATAVWSTPDRVPFMSIANKALSTVFEIPPPPAGAPGPFALANVDTLTAEFQQAGFENVASHKVDLIFQFSSADSFVEFTRDCAARVNTLLADKTSDIQDQAWSAVADEAKNYANADGNLEIPGEAICVAGQK